MYEEFDISHGVNVTKDIQNIVREISHLQQPFKTDAQTPQQAAQIYLEKYQDLFKIKPEELKKIGLPPEDELLDTKIEYRLVEEKTFFDVTTVGYQQTYFGLPVWESGIAVHIKHNPLRVIRSTSTAHQDIKVAKPSEKALRRFRKVSAKDFGSLGISWIRKDDKEFDFKSFSLNHTRFIIYRYDKTKRLQEKGRVKNTREQVFPHTSPTLPLPPVDDNIKDGQHYVSAEILFTLTTTRWGTLNWIAIIDVETASVLYLRALVDNVDGMIFTADPATQGSAVATNANNTALNPLRTSITLQGLSAPSGGNQSLSGTYVQVTDHESPTIAPPSEATGTNFNYNVRTNNFAAVNCYHHCDNVFRLIEDLGFTIGTYFDGTTFPVSIDHRGRFGTLDGIEINASCGGNAASNGIGLPDFELADLTDTDNPLGIAVDKRVVMHELFGHGILWDHVNSANFGFAHSAGDSFAAILCDPDSQSTDRFLTFPWLTPTRRHDRSVASGFGWNGASALNPFDGVLDPGGYNNEQTLSTTNFRVYRSIGGDSGRVETRRFAARYMAYLMLRAVATLTPATNPNNGSGFASALMSADLTDWTSEGHAGGAYGKVIRWAFEKQGMYQAAGTPTPNNNEGVPPPIDVYIDDGRQGEYQYLPNHWSCQNIWNRLISDGGTSHQPPVVGVTNYAYVKIKNRGSQTATNVIVKGFHCQPSSGLVWPNDWQAMTTAQLSAPDVPPNNSSEITVGPFEWVPSQLDHECMLMIVSSDGDPSNIDNFSGGDSIPEWRLVPHDNNIGQRNVAPVPGGGGFRGLLTAFSPRQFVVRNPHHVTARIEVVPTLPNILLKRNWEFVFHNPGGRAFSLEPGQSREIVLRLKTGNDFTPQDIAQTQDRTIHFETFANGILVGGMSYELDPTMKVAPSQFPTKLDLSDMCTGKAKDLLDCIELPVKKVKSVRVRKITIDIEIENESDC